MAKVTSLRSKQAETGSDERQLRIDLAAAFRLAAQFDWHESVGNHFSLAVSEDGRKFLMNPRFRHFSRIRASDLLLLDGDDPETLNRPDAPEVTGWCIHGALHRALPRARCVMHLHTRYATALSSLADPEVKPIDQNTARFYRRHAVDRHFGGLADSTEEGARLARMLGNHDCMIMANHGVLVIGETVAQTFETLYYLERSCETLMLAYASGRPINTLSEEIAEKTAQGWERYDVKGLAQSFFAELKRNLDDEGATYAQ